MRGGLCRGERGGDRALTEEDKLSQDEKPGLLTRLSPGTRKCLLIRTTAGEKMPEQTDEATDEQGETIRWKETGEVTQESCAADQLFPPSEPPEKMDSLEEDGVASRSAQLVWLILSSGTIARFTK